jgi:uncharacterized protein YkwD
MFRRVLVALLFVSLFTSSTLFGRAVSAQEVPQFDPTVVRVVELVNHERAMAGLPPVGIHSILMNEAARFSGVQASMGRLSHAGNDGTTAGQRLRAAGYNWSAYGENLAAGQDTPEQVVAAWMASPGHRAIILHGKAVDIGIGHTFRADDPSFYGHYWVLEIAKSKPY